MQLSKGTAAPAPRTQPLDFVIGGVIEKSTMPRADSAMDSKPKELADMPVAGPLCSGALYNVRVTGARPAGLG
ncbi:MAG TPA: hypothetical protein VD863_24305 [Bradyrhizobium sp.]|nr:hypothetical protein [Bradyrhizobium sp.]